MNRPGLVPRVRPVQGSPDKSVLIRETMIKPVHKLDRRGIWGDAQLPWAGIVNTWAPVGVRLAGLWRSQQTSTAVNSCIWNGQLEIELKNRSSQKPVSERVYNYFSLFLMTLGLVISDCCISNSTKNLTVFQFLMPLWHFEIVVNKKKSSYGLLAFLCCSRNWRLCWKTWWLCLNW